LTDVGAYASSPSYYGTFDQGGNVWEWNETASNAFRRIFRGGSWSGDGFDLAALQHPPGSPTYGTNPTLETCTFGFRMATIVPEPCSAFLAVVASMLICCSGRRRGESVEVGLRENS